MLSSVVVVSDAASCRTVFKMPGAELVVKGFAAAENDTVFDVVDEIARLAGMRGSDVAALLALAARRGGFYYASIDELPELFTALLRKN